MWTKLRNLLKRNDNEVDNSVNISEEKGVDD